MIPNRFHFVFGLKRQTEPFHLVHYLCLASCIEVNRPEAIYFYYHYEPYGRYWDLIKDRLILIKVQLNAFIDNYKYQDRMVSKYKYAHAADFIRLEKLLDQGGVYADMDTLFVNPIPKTLFDKSFVLGREDDVKDVATGKTQTSLCNAFIMAERNAPFGRMWLDEQNNAFDGSWSQHSTLLPDRLAQKYPDLVHIEPPRSFYKHMWTPEGLKNLFNACDADNEGVISMHLWAHLWWSRWRCDFSDFHAGLLTEKFIREVDTTYNLLARKFLPPSQSFDEWCGRWVLKTEHIRNYVNNIALLVFVATKLLAFSVLNDRVFPNCTQHLDYAKRQWKHRGDRRPLGTDWERRNIFDSIILYDEYQLRDVRFSPEDVILDIGAHVGVFSDLCHQRGSRLIHAYEPELKNFRRLARTVADRDGIYLHNLAVFRSDVLDDLALTHSGHLDDNTGGGNVIFGGQKFEAHTQELSPSPLVQKVTTISLDEVLESFPRVRLLKLDCEGSEFPILLTSSKLERIDEIILEYHECIPPAYDEIDSMARISGYSAYKVIDLQTHLEACGFSVMIYPTVEYMGFMRALRHER